MMTSDRPVAPRTEDFRFHCDIEVRFRDLDATATYNAVYATYFEVRARGTCGRSAWGTRR